MFVIGPLFQLQDFFTSFRTGSLFSFTCFFNIYFIQAPFFIHMFFTCFMQAPFFSFTCFLHVSYTSAFFSFTCFLHVSYRPPFFIYMFFTCFLHAPFFPFTWFLQGFKRSISRLRVAFGRIIYTFFTGFSKAIYMFFTTEDTVKVRKIIYRFLHVLQIMIVEKDNVNQYLQNIYMPYQKL